MLNFGKGSLGLGLVISQFKAMLRARYAYKVFKVLFLDSSFQGLQEFFEQ
jgi:hypothetical protein